MRRDALGIFWRDEPVIKVLKQKIKRTPPEPTWLSPDYLPGLDEAEVLAGITLFTDDELFKAGSKLWSGKKTRLTYDIEIYENYFLIAFMCLETERCVFVELSDHKPFCASPEDFKKLQWILENFILVGFNNLSFDTTILSMALAGKTVRQMKNAATMLIRDEMHPAEVLKFFKVKKAKLDQIDLIEVAPLRGSLKAYAGRFHCKKMQDLPFHPDVHLSIDQQIITRYYCFNDLRNTAGLYRMLEENVKLRETMSAEYKMDLRSKSDAQIAEYVFTSEVEKLNGYRTARPTIPPGTLYRYRVPAFLQYTSPLLRWALDIVSKAAFIVAEHGAVAEPVEFAKLKLEINGSTYQMGIGGLHSTEKCIAHVSDDEYQLFDYDVTSYYPKVILNQKLYPYHMGPAFLIVYQRTVDRRIEAKIRKDKVASNALKIVVNGSFGKLGSKYSNLYAPDLLIQVTVTGQLALLMLIERLELAGISVVSGNTDGIVIKCKKTLILTMEAVVKQWEKDTDFEMERTVYRALYSRDVNSYIAVKPDGKTKTKGAYANPWSDDGDKSMWLHKNPVNLICTEAIEKLLGFGVPLVTTITGCTDIRKFVTVRWVGGGAVKNGEYLGKNIRWYYAKDELGEIIIAKSGNKVPRSDNAKPLMELPDACPNDIDYDWYIAEAEKMLAQLGYA